MSAEEKERIALFGGSFNPPHVAHMMVAVHALVTRPVDAVWLVPTFRHAFGKVLAPFEDRLEMCRLAAAALGPRLSVSDVEGQLGGESRTVYTLRHLREENRRAQFALLVGSDVLGERHAWLGWEEIQSTTEIWAVRRPGGPPTDEPSIEMPAVSSTEVRRRLAAGEPVAHLVPRAVLEHIEQRRLYQSATPENQ